MKEAPGDVIVQKAFEKHIPLYAHIELTYRCNLRCVHCFIPEGLRNSDEELSTEQVFDIIDQLADAGTLKLTLSGGEPLFRQDFFAIAEYARNRNMALGIISNGTLIDEAVVKRFKQLHFNDIAISLYGLTPQTHEAVTGVPGSLSRTVRAIKLLKENGFKVTIKTPVMKQNLCQVPELDNWCQALELGFNPNPIITCDINGSDRPRQHSISEQGLRDFLVWQAKNEKDISTLTTVCNSGICVVTISAQGEVYPCSVLRMRAGSLTKERFARIWADSPVLKKLRRTRFEDFRECPQCHLLELCPRCPGNSFLEQGDFLAPSREACKVARIRKEIIDEKAISKA